MQWKDINYVHHGLTVTILFDTPEDPGVVIKRSGRVECRQMGHVPTLVELGGKEHWCLPPDRAFVIFHTPDAPNWHW